MPRSPKRPCRYPGCPNLCKSGTYCPEHSAASPDRLRGNAAERGYDANAPGKEALPAAPSPVCELPVAGRPHAGHGRGPYRPAPGRPGVVLG
mgnify:CR=1 FL=1